MTSTKSDKKPKIYASAEEKIADNVVDIIATESVASHESVGRISWVGFGLIILVVAYLVMNDTIGVQEKILAFFALLYLQQCILALVGAVSRVAQKAASILGILAMFTATYEQSGLNVMRAFFDGISKAAESSETENEQAKTEVENR